MLEKVLDQLNHRRKSYGLCGAFYNDPDVYQMDLEEIWYRDWIFVGHDLEIPNRGDCMTFPIGDVSVVAINTGEGLKAFRNICPVTSAPLILESKAHVESFQGGDSGPSYSLDGQSDEAHELIEVNLKCISHYLFACLADQPSDIEEFSHVVSPYLAPHCQQPLKVAFQSNIVEEGNWKLVFENNRECYHCLSNHPELIITYPEDPAVTGVSPNGKLPEMVSEHWQRCEAAGLPSQFKLSSKGNYRVARMPLLKDFTSYTMHGGDAVSKRLIDVGFDNTGALMLFHYPNTWNHFLGDHIISFRMLPLSPQSTLVTTTWLVRADAEEGVDYDIPTLTEVWEATNAEDRYLVEENQRGINSPLYQPGPYSEHLEDGVIQFVDWYSETLSLRLQQRTLLQQRVA